jgi:hypothetical protein
LSNKIPNTIPLYHRCSSVLNELRAYRGKREYKAHKSFRLYICASRMFVHLKPGVFYLRFLIAHPKDILSGLCRFDRFLQRISTDFRPGTHGSCTHRVIAQTYYFWWREWPSPTVCSDRRPREELTQVQQREELTPVPQRTHQTRVHLFNKRSGVLLLVYSAQWGVVLEKPN